MPCHYVASVNLSIFQGSYGRNALWGLKKSKLFPRRQFYQREIQYLELVYFIHIAQNTTFFKILDTIFHF
jgi:hypothetical protein